MVADFADYQDFFSAIKFLTRRNQVEHESMLPAAIASYDRTKNLASVTPLIQWKNTDGTSQNRPTVANIPVLSNGGGGFHLSFPLAQGDLGWILASDRDLSGFLKSLKSSSPTVYRMHSFSDSMFIPDVFRQYVIDGADSNSMVLQTTDAKTRIAIDKGGNINITAPSSVNVKTPKANFSDDVNIGGNLIVTKNTTVNGGFNANGSGSSTVSLPSNTTVNGINIANHGHQQQNNGSGRTAAGMVA